MKNLAKVVVLALVSVAVLAGCSRRCEPVCKEPCARPCAVEKEYSCK